MISPKKIIFYLAKNGNARDTLYEGENFFRK